MSTKTPPKTCYVLGGDLVNTQYPLKLHLKPDTFLVDAQCPLVNGCASANMLKSYYNIIMIMMILFFFF